MKACRTKIDDTIACCFKEYILCTRTESARPTPIRIIAQKISFPLQINNRSSVGSDFYHSKCPPMTE